MDTGSMASQTRPITPVSRKVSIAHTTHGSPSSGIMCPSCGSLCATTPSQLGGDAQRRIAELEAQVKLLTEKANQAADRISDYQEELRRWQSDNLAGANPGRRPSQQQQHPQTHLQQPRPQDRPPLSAPSSTSRFSSLLARRNTPPQSARTNSSPSVHPTGSAEDPSINLTECLERETHLRRAAESQLAQMSAEVEELSATLFGQANEMVASERKARAALEDRVEVLELRERERKGRLERLEGAVRRIDRVRGVLEAKGMPVGPIGVGVM